MNDDGKPITLNLYTLAFSTEAVALTHIRLQHTIVWRSDTPPRRFQIPRQGTLLFTTALVKKEPKRDSAIVYEDHTSMANRF